MVSTKKILIMGLPGSGKTTLAVALKQYIEIYGSKFQTQPEKIRVDWFNADEIRKQFNDWDFSHNGRIRQSLRMSEFALKCNGSFVICDFVAPLPEMRNNFGADWTVWVDTIKQSKYEDTNTLFVPPEVYDFRVTEKDVKKWSSYIGETILKKSAPSCL